MKNFNDFQTYKNAFINMIIELNNTDLIHYCIEDLEKCNTYIDLWNLLYEQLMYTNLKLEDLPLYNDVLNNIAFINYFKDKFKVLVYCDYLNLLESFKKENKEELINTLNSLIKLYVVYCKDEYIKMYEHELKFYDAKNAMKEYYFYNEE